MWKEKSPGVKILWIWTIGTAAILIQMDTQQSIHPNPPAQESEPVIADDSAGFVREDKF
ncbi:hypothetical protein DCAR_0208676 [Daucus carota subsp. sativus]|uniref:Uncharacterized protein n=1 Tax=Daucus carota subsp. sativus TaxID=79200 RepID=A0AAF0WJJ7_DAUCS|nr:hypothetical protein DCAR_0208676 [Daucus carota subsp. sativus]